VSKKVSKSAVVRNRIRRRLYNLLRQHRPAITRPYDIVITVFDERVASMPGEELAHAVAVQLGQAGIISASPEQGRRAIVGEK
ncbi:MAG TPA: ribonuclease P protein component, partial [Candidatus Saccharimonadales bacterium]|nr:ribonuclease P protein component [Candidatus Saccharimonadales bacterium]